MIGNLYNYRRSFRWDYGREALLGFSEPTQVPKTFGTFQVQ